MLGDYVLRLEQAGRGERGQIIEEIRSFFGWSKDKAYRELKKEGWESGRSRRRDSGETGVSDEALMLLAAKLKTGIRKDGRHVTDIPTARWMLEQENSVYFGVSNARLATLLRERGMDMKSLKAPSPFVRMRSLHPNHVHQVDPSVCLVYYLPGGGQRIIKADEVYKNKPYLAGKEDLKVWRYVLTDHYSSSVCIRYYNTAGEDSRTLWDFLMYAWSPKQNPEYLFHGVPRMLYWDKGSANKSGAIKNALKSLDVEELSHMPGRPRAKGQVEKSNHLMETHFECHLKDDPAANVAQLNEWTERWCAAYNANTIQGYDSTLGRAGRSRAELWRTITISELRELPEGARELLVSNAVNRKVGGDLTISFVHPRLKESLPYKVGGYPGIRPGMTIQVQPLLMDAGGSVRISWKYQGEELEERVNPVEIETLTGFQIDAPVWGESYKSHGDTFVDQASKKLDELIGSDRRPFAHLNNGEGLKSISSFQVEKSNISSLPVTGMTIKPDQAPAVILNYMEAADRLRAKIGHWDKSWLMVLRDNFPGGVPDRELDTIAETLSTLGGIDGIKSSFG